MAIYAFAQNVGLLGCMFIAAILPKDDDKTDLASNKTWRIIFAMPMVAYAIILLALLVLIKHDSPKYYIALN